MSTWPYRVAREQRAIKTLLAAVSVALLVTACYDDDSSNYAPTDPAPPAPTVVTGSGDIAPKVDEYRALLGDPRNGGSVPGPAASGRREVNWDGVNGANLNSNTFPGDFFAATTKLGMVMTTPGTTCNWGKPTKARRSTSRNSGPATFVSDAAAVGFSAMCDESGSKLPPARSPRNF